MEFCQGLLLHNYMQVNGRPYELWVCCRDSCRCYVDPIIELCKRIYVEYDIEKYVGAYRNISSHLQEVVYMDHGIGSYEEACMKYNVGKYKQIYM
jgi:hypothetical protein